MNMSLNFGSKLWKRQGVARLSTVTGKGQLIHKSLWQPQAFVNGEFTNGVAKESFSVTNPSNGEVIATLPKMGVADVEATAKIAFDSWQTWKLTTAKERSNIIMKMANLMEKYQEDLATIITLESGKPMAESRGEVAYAMSFYQYYAEEAKRIHGDVLPNPVDGRRLVALKQPVGPAALITPWNFPSAMITRKAGPALAAGCTVVIKPSEETPLSALALCQIAKEAGLPDGVMNCLTIDRTDVVETGLAICHSPLLRKVSFTGSTGVGKWLMRESASTVKRISLELGGNAPFIVFDDADIPVAVNALMLSKFRNAGQACIASNRIFVQSGIYDKFTAAVVEKAATLKCGDGFTDGSTCGPLINAAGLKKVEQHVQDCVEKGANICIGGVAHSTLNAQGGTYFEPTVLTNVSLEMLPMCDETFGPIVPIRRFDTEAEVIELANDTQYGLAAYFCTKDLSRTWRMSEALEFGVVGVNEGAVSADLVPFGGVKESGIGREGGPYGIQEYLETK